MLGQRIITALRVGVGEGIRVGVGFEGGWSGRGEMVGIGGLLGGWVGGPLLLVLLSGMVVVGLRWIG